MNAEQHALAILRAIQEAESAGYVVAVTTRLRSSNGRCSGLTVADVYVLAEPQEEDGVWDWEAGE